MLKKILIANRGEIALRIWRTCEKLGIATATVHSEADAQAPHARITETYLIGPPPVAASYLQIDAILDAAKQAGADAIHPGYGLLSENAEFARRVKEAGLTFIGPTPEAIEAMGIKTKARQIMVDAGVPVVPGEMTSLGDVQNALTAADRLGYPVMLKAAAGGGGIGMQLAQNPIELEKAYKLCAARAKAYFGNDMLYLEKAIEAPRHIEIQILADHHGQVVHLFERDCSIQRRHQKVVEEAVSPFVDDDLRDRMGAVAVQAAKAIGYQNAGTLEFLVDADKNFYFLEMNTRLQVEHPVTEEITGLDLVAEQIRIAAGEPLGYTQADIHQKAHSIECRIYAEDPNTFLPSPGTIQELTLPEGEGIRLESAIESGYVVTPFYDPMLAKLVVTGRDRAEAIARLTQALDAFQIVGIKSNLPLLRRIVADTDFQAGHFNTDFLSQLLADKAPAVV